MRVIYPEEIIFTYGTLLFVDIKMSSIDSFTMCSHLINTSLCVSRMAQSQHVPNRKNTDTVVSYGRLIEPTPMSILISCKIHLRGVLDDFRPGSFPNYSSYTVL